MERQSRSRARKRPMSPRSGGARREAEEQRADEEDSTDSAEDGACCEARSPSVEKSLEKLRSLLPASKRENASDAEVVNSFTKMLKNMKEEVDRAGLLLQLMEAEEEAAELAEKAAMNSIKQQPHLLTQDYAKKAKLVIEEMKKECNSDQDASDFLFMLTAMNEEMEQSTSP